MTCPFASPTPGTTVASVESPSPGSRTIDMPIMASSLNFTSNVVGCARKNTRFGVCKSMDAPPTLIDSITLMFNFETTRLSIALGVGTKGQLTLRRKAALTAPAVICHVSLPSSGTSTNALSGGTALTRAPSPTSSSATCSPTIQGSKVRVSGLFSPLKKVAVVSVRSPVHFDFYNLVGQVLGNHPSRDRLPITLQFRTFKTQREKPAIRVGAGRRDTPQGVGALQWCGGFKRWIENEP